MKQVNPIKLILFALIISVTFTSPTISQDDRGIKRKSNEKEHRVALVIGNANYKVCPLKNPTNDAENIANIIKQKGFQVQLLLDANRRKMNDAIREFSKRLQRGGVKLFYFCGHGVGLNGQNYIIPVDTRIDSESDVKYECINLNGVFTRVYKNCKEPYNGNIFAYATAPGKTALDGKGRNGHYAKYIIEKINKPGVEIHEMFREIRKAVEKETQGKQVPYEVSSAKKKFFFTPLKRDDFEGSFLIFILDAQQDNPFANRS